MQPTRQRGDQHWTRRAPERILRGTAAPGAKLNAFEIAELCDAYDQGETQTRLAMIYGVSRYTIWRHLKDRAT